MTTVLSVTSSPPFLATAALKHSAPHLPGVAPRRVIGGHFLGAVVGVVVGSVAGQGALAVALAASVASVAMMSVDLLHAPGVATAAVAVQLPGFDAADRSLTVLGAAGASSRWVQLRVMASAASNRRRSESCPAQRASRLRPRRSTAKTVSATKARSAWPSSR